MDIGGADKGTTAAWMATHGGMYERATRHPFTVSIRDGTVDLAAFKRWLVSTFSAFLLSGSHPQSLTQLAFHLIHGDYSLIGLLGCCSLT
jgi:hypothetical protein